jgi:hypothetical protein
MDLGYTSAEGKRSFHLKVNRYYRMKSIRNGKLKIDSEGGEKEEIELPWPGGGIGRGGEATEVILK